MSFFSELGSIQKIVLLISVALLLFILISLYQSFVASKNTTPWPPTSQNCPDYWAETTNNVCKNTHNLNKCSSNTIDFSSYSLCDKYNWATGVTLKDTCGDDVQWDGLSYGYGKYNPCTTGYTPATI